MSAFYMSVFAIFEWKIPDAARIRFNLDYTFSIAKNLTFSRINIT